MKRALLSLFCLGLSFALSAQTYERLSAYEENLMGRSIHVNGSFDAMQQVRKYWNKEYKRLSNEHYQISLCGNGECVFKVTIPSRLLFVQNDSTMLVQADGMLRPFLRLVRGKEAKASVVIACHSDNNGSEQNLNHITAARAESVCDWLIKQGVTAKVKTFGLGNHAPLNENSTLKEREQNRRVTLYLVPNKQMMKLAKKKKLIN